MKLFGIFATLALAQDAADNSVTISVSIKCAQIKLKLYLIIVLEQRKAKNQSLEEKLANHG